ncbi:UbiC transcription regulator-associated domain protein [Sphingobacterium spiritivorum ATCC 33300]|uniref:UbiC transcription regulator-associated domain protein n=3 Tax=Sphingobacterium spiritivorum TaxID=258 RepID=D7VTC0_SPHSI|nr:GntR family transcriptional regulator [Sphingobacterium spiritivorum]EEI90491.1 UbiC transcription regulator-associated domain protein [Sphingobacterium spiritivorum ATCC 33300]EFK57021.1 UbiC transcription regulator-associated domain protein [Sphingobacterium spiritivorum ATCC 33861]QQS95228.1 GntR family transcriptional regulator [Sphingobacterium spiritivorum]QQT34972.1 GntR family transcriptional regulator [Sphingobacterium spiritivorum]WQD35867.1 GntR family transcriptional regulator [
MNLQIDHKSPVPLHIQAEMLLRELIKDPEYIDGKLLPNEVELARRLAISRTTLRLAINKLVYEELLVRKKGVGTKVVTSKFSSKSKNWLSFSQEMKNRGIEVKNFELHVSWVVPEKSIMHFFDIKEDQKILKLERLRGKKDDPFVYFVSYFHPRIGLTGDEDFKRPLYEILEQDHHIIADLSQEEIDAKAANKFIADKLEINQGDPILSRKRFVYDQSGRPIEYNLGYYRAESFTYTVESRRDY